MQLGEVARLRVIINLCATFTISNFHFFAHQMESESILKFNGVIFGKLPLWGMVSHLWHVSLVCHFWGMNIMNFLIGCDYISTIHIFYNMRSWIKLFFFLLTV